MWFLGHYRAESASVNCPAAFRIHGRLDDDRIAAAVTRLERRHDALRTTLERDRRELVQVVHEEPTARIEWTSLPAGAEDELTEQYAAELRAPIAVREWPVRWHVWRLGPEDTVLAANMHHLVSDAWSCGVLIDDVLALLGADGPAADLPPIGWQYPDYAAWQHGDAENGALAAHQDYWKSKLDGMRMPALPGTAAATGEPALALGTIPADQADALRTFAKTHRTTLFSIMLSLYYRLLHQETGQADLTVASLFANRMRPEVQKTVGFFANMLALRTTLDPDRPFTDLLRATQRTVMDAVVHQSVPYQMVPVPSLRDSGGRVDDVVFQMLPDRRPESWNPTDVGAGLRIDTFRPSQGLSRFGLNLTVIPRATGFDVRLSYTRDRFTDAWAEDFVRRYVALVPTILGV